MKLKSILTHKDPGTITVRPYKAGTGFFSLQLEKTVEGFCLDSSLVDCSALIEPVILFTFWQQDFSHSQGGWSSLRRPSTCHLSLMALDSGSALSSVSHLGPIPITKLLIQSFTPLDPGSISPRTLGPYCDLAYHSFCERQPLRTKATPLVCACSRLRDCEDLKSLKT